MFNDPPPMYHNTFEQCGQKCKMMGMLKLTSWAGCTIHLLQISSQQSSIIMTLAKDAETICFCGANNDLILILAFFYKS